MLTLEQLALARKMEKHEKPGGSTAAPALAVEDLSTPVASKTDSVLLTGLHGFCMALADSVPGVSGGTIAFILGFYERLLTALHGLTVHDGILRKQSLMYLLKLGLGWAVGMLAANLALVQVFELHVYFMSSLFLGLTAVSIPMVLHSELATLKRKPWAALFLPLGIAMVVGLVIVRTSAVPWIAINFQRLSPDSVLYLFLSGMIAICAMALPGISGSTLLMVFGVYVPTVYAVGQVMALQFSFLPALLVLAFGAITGLLLFIRTLKKALSNYRPEMIYLILGLMVGSLYAICAGPTTLSVPKEALSLSTFNILGFLLGGIILIVLERLQAKLQPSTRLSY